MDKNRIRVLLADDWSIARDGLKMAIQTVDDIEVVGEVTNTSETLRKVKECSPDVVLMDLKWFGDDTAGQVAIKKIKDALPKTRIIAITAYENLIRDARKAGADDALTKTFTRDQLLDLIRDVVARKEETVSLPQEERQLSDPLTERELEVLGYLVKGVPDKTIAAYLSIAESTAKNHVKSILSKLDAKNRTEAASKAREMGLI